MAHLSGLAAPQRANIERPLDTAALLLGTSRDLRPRLPKAMHMNAQTSIIHKRQKVYTSNVHQLKMNK